MSPFEAGRREHAKLLVKSMLASARRAEKLLNDLPAPVGRACIGNEKDRREAARHWAAVTAALTEASVVAPAALEAATEAAREVPT